ncbi:BlaI/MecI/CopY family transcriptional regulator [Thermoactinomyces sp. DSM 45892]|uniref:BlaI/MecI/CopY family transcriptional regulator n=1 Tax=Thermoactinomyces sp. DSM 45892 TaxID=1882753 RepID=UPI0008999C2E|nr:BlaI/MecI/CopY family transcriptional regulator [Thermoactinomyces sp. DSM 45892]SDY25584.1 BlaI family transcriptional regulator, penicillinase repressor [Thermoactinomyces sp. DSM 45892]
MGDLPKISQSEWEIMKVLWARSPLTANEVIETLAVHTDWKPKTIRTLINRLVQKEAISYHQEHGSSYAYYPLVSQAECVQEETTSFLKRVSGGALKPFLVNFLQKEKLSTDEINELKQILDEKADK